MIKRDSESRSRLPVRREIQLAPWLARVVVAIVIGNFGIVGVIGLAGNRPAPALLALGMVDIVVILTMQVFHFGSTVRRNGPGRLRWLAA
ncbi:MAG: hypothetical protein J2P17_13490, partial [Mycobacterium sp.]|nr:hypothetical protein [Mycobacterium sp.]